MPKYVIHKLYRGSSNSTVRFLGPRKNPQYPLINHSSYSTDLSFIYHRPIYFQRQRQHLFIQVNKSTSNDILSLFIVAVVISNNNMNFFLNRKQRGPDFRDQNWAWGCPMMQGRVGGMPRAGVYLLLRVALSLMQQYLEDECHFDI